MANKPTTVVCTTDEADKREEESAWYDISKYVLPSAVLCSGLYFWLQARSSRDTDDCENDESSSSSDRCSKKTPKNKGKRRCEKEKYDPIVGTWTTSINFPNPAGGSIPVFGTSRYMSDGSAIGGDTAGLGQLASYIPPNYIDSVFTGDWKKVGHKEYHIFFTWVENELTGNGGNAWPTTPRQRRACLTRVKMTSPTYMFGTLSVNYYALSDTTLSSPTPLISGPITIQKWTTQNPSLFPA